MELSLYVSMCVGGQSESLQHDSFGRSGEVHQGEVATLATTLGLGLGLGARSDELEVRK